MIDGRINVDCLFHDRSGTARLKVLSLRSSTKYNTGEALFVTGTAGTASVAIQYASYRNASGSLVQISSPSRIAFSWSGSSQRSLDDTGGNGWRLISANSEVVTTLIGNAEPVPLLLSGSGTGVYSVIIWGAD